MPKSRSVIGTLTKNQANLLGVEFLIANLEVIQEKAQNKRVSFQQKLSLRYELGGVIDRAIDGVFIDYRTSRRILSEALITPFQGPAELWFSPIFNLIWRALDAEKVRLKREIKELN